MVRRISTCGFALLAISFVWLTGCGGDMPTEPSEPTGPNHNEGDLVVELPGGAKMAFIWIEPGTFMMGAGPGEVGDPEDLPLERPQHQVTLTKGFYIGKYEVTQGQWESVVGTRPWEEMGGQSDRDYPATNISWVTANEFVGKLSEAAGAILYRLPTEAEWEYACRAGTTTAWSFEEQTQAQFSLGEYAWYSTNSEDRMHKVGTRLPNPWGLYDMHGNASEWVWDIWDGSGGGGYPDAEPRVDPTGAPDPGWLPAGYYRIRILRGGSYRNGWSRIRSASRSIVPTSWYDDPDIGFRIVRETP